MSGARPRIAAWPMYAVDAGDVRRFWQALRGSLVASGVADVPDALTEPDLLSAHWRDPALLLSQTCGYPLATVLKAHVRYVATPRFRAPGCAGALYASAVMVRDREAADGIADLRDRRVAFNSRDSHSGYNALRALVAPFAGSQRFFRASLETGSHRGSIAALRAGKADVAAIDAVTLALLSKRSPDEVHGLRVLCRTALVPGLPIVTASSTGDAEVARLRDALAAVCRPEVPAARALLFDGIEVLPPGAYDAILAAEASATAQGYPELR